MWLWALLKKHFCWILSSKFSVFESDFWFPLLYINAFKEPHFEKTCICREIKFIIVVNVFSVSCVCFKEIFSVHYGKCIQLTQNETSDKHESSVFCEHHLRQNPFNCTAQKFVLDICWEAFLQFRFAFPSISLIFLIYLNGQRHVSHLLYLK